MKQFATSFGAGAATGAALVTLVLAPAVLLAGVLTLFSKP